MTSVNVINKRVRVGLFEIKQKCDVWMTVKKWDNKLLYSHSQLTRTIITQYLHEFEKNLLYSIRLGCKVLLHFVLCVMYTLVITWQIIRARNPSPRNIIRHFLLLFCSKPRFQKFSQVDQTWSVKQLQAWSTSRRNWRLSSVKTILFFLL